MNLRALMHALVALAFFQAAFGQGDIKPRVNTSVVQDFPNCIAPQSAKGMVGDRAILSSDGSSLVLQCGDEEILQWDAGQSTVNRLGKVPLFSAALDQGIIPAKVRCPSRSGSSGADCDLIDHTDDWTAYLVKTMGGTRYAVSSNPPLQRELPVYSAGVLLPRAGSADRIVIPQGSSKGLEVRSLSDWTATALLQIPDRDQIFQDGESRIYGVSYSRAHKLLIASCGGAFIYFEGDVGFIRAYDLSGVERWSIRRPLPKPERHGGLHAGFTSLFAQVHQFANGRVATIAASQDRSSFDVISLETGEKLGSFPGWPVGASEQASRVLVRTAEHEVALFDLTETVQQTRPIPD